MDRADSLDRRLGELVREWLEAVPGGTRTGILASEVMSPVFTAAVAGLMLTRRGRRAGIEAGVAAVVAAGCARLLRDGIGRPRPGPRAGGGFPSRHAAAGVAIARAVGRGHPVMGSFLAVAAAAGLAGRVVAGEHDPGDIVAGAALGWYVDAVVGGAARLVEV